MMEEQQQAEAHRQSRLGQILIRKGYISREQLNEAVHLSIRHDQRLGEYLIEHGMISRWQLRRALSSQSQQRLSAGLSMALLSAVYEHLASKNAGLSDNSLTLLLKPLQTTGSATELSFDPNLASLTIRENGLLHLRIPSSLGELNFDGLQLKADGTRSYDNLTIDDLDLSDAKLFIRTIHHQLNPALP